MIIHTQRIGAIEFLFLSLRVKEVLINVDYQKLGRTVKMSALWFCGLALWVSIASGKILFPAQNDWGEGGVKKRIQLGQGYMK